METMIRGALEKAEIRYVDDSDERAKGLDFYLLDQDVHIECKQFHTDSISEQMSLCGNVIAIQGIQAAELFSDLLSSAAGRQD